MNTQPDELQKKIQDRSAVLCIMGLGYVGLPLAMEMLRPGYSVLGLDTNLRIVAGLNAGRSHIRDVPSSAIQHAGATGRWQVSSDLERLGACDAIAVCVPTPLSKTKDPDLSYVIAAAERLAETLRPGQMVILESTTFPGTTREVVLPILERSGLRVGRDFFLCFSPERVDPGNPTWNTRNTPKVLGGITDACLAHGRELYESIFDTVVPVSSTEAAELTKVYENTFRMVGIALANELAQVCDKLGVDVWEVVDAAGTKPFGFMKFVPGPGLGGHCIPLDPHYLSWKMRTLQYNTRLIETASEINAEMPLYVVSKVMDALNTEGKALNGARVLVVGIAYKPDIDDLRESPAIEILYHLQQKGARVEFHDPLCPQIDEEVHVPLQGLPLHSVSLERVGEVDAVVLVTNHSILDLERISQDARVVIDARGALRNRSGAARIVGLSRDSRAGGNRKESEA